MAAKSLCMQAGPLLIIRLITNCLTTAEDLKTTIRELFLEEGGGNLNLCVAWKIACKSLAISTQRDLVATLNINIY